MPSLDSEVAEEKELAENLVHVTFTPARVKYIVHPHASSLLATEDPVVEVSHEMRERAEKVFASHAVDPPARVEESKDEDGKHSEEKEDIRQPYVSRSIVSQLMKECGAFVLATDEQSEMQSEAALVKIVSLMLTVDTFVLHITLTYCVHLISRPTSTFSMQTELHLRSLSLFLRDIKPLPSTTVCRYYFIVNIHNIYTIIS